jgi:Family of unknown function (DUF5871)
MWQKNCNIQCRLYLIYIREEKMAAISLYKNIEPEAFTFGGIHKDSHVYLLRPEQKIFVQTPVLVVKDSITNVSGEITKSAVHIDTCAKFTGWVNAVEDHIVDFAIKNKHELFKQDLNDDFIRESFKPSVVASTELSLHVHPELSVFDQDRNILGSSSIKIGTRISAIIMLHSVRFTKHQFYCKWILRSARLQKQPEYCFIDKDDDEFTITDASESVVDPEDQEDHEIVDDMLDVPHADVGLTESFESAQSKISLHPQEAIKEETIKEEIEEELEEEIKETMEEEIVEEEIEEKVKEEIEEKVKEEIEENVKEEIEEKVEEEKIEEKVKEEIEEEIKAEADEEVVTKADEKVHEEEEIISDNADDVVEALDIDKPQFVEEISEEEEVKEEDQQEALQKDEDKKEEVVQTIFIKVKDF